MGDNWWKYEDIPCGQFFSIWSIVTPKLLKNSQNWPYNPKFLQNKAHFRNHSLFYLQLYIWVIIGKNLKIFLVADFSLFDRLWRQKCRNWWKMVKIDHIIQFFLQNKAHFRDQSLFYIQLYIWVIIGENMKIFLVANFSLFDRLWRQKCQNWWKMVKIGRW